MKKLLFAALAVLFLLPGCKKVAPSNLPEEAFPWSAVITGAVTSSGMNIGEGYPVTCTIQGKKLQTYTDANGAFEFVYYSTQKGSVPGATTLGCEFKMNGDTYHGAVNLANGDFQVVGVSAGHKKYQTPAKVIPVAK